MSDSHDPASEPEAPNRLRRWLAPRLLAWFAKHRRDLPWRSDRDPYRIWVSEVMLQQTQVATVIGYFERFLARFPTIADLAAADEQEVLRFWEGLGYYRRARDLRCAAIYIVDQHEGKIPPDPQALAQLPGMGQYTRNAVLSQAFDLRLPILEVNTQRVLSRIFGREEDPRQGPARRWLWEASEQILPSRQVGDFNQALMELGALVCTPTAPRCGDCPLSSRCQAFKTNRQDEIPRKAAAPETTYIQEAAVVITREEKVLLGQRPATGRWANLWEFPHAALLPGEAHEQAAIRLVPELTGIHIRLGPELITLSHGITRYQITIVCFEADWLSGEFLPNYFTQGIWIDPGELVNYPVSSPQRRLTRQLLRTDRQRRLF